MGRVVYYNITYKCNNNCKFCFSYNVGSGKSDICYETMCDELEKMELNKNDLLVINGGEPTMYYKIEKLLIFIKKLNCRIAFYTNGTFLKNYIDLIREIDNIRFIIPIHGTEEMHDGLTCIKGSYKKTISTLYELQDNKIKYEIKFIIGEEMIKTQFDIDAFLNNHKLNPSSVVLARINKTRKSVQNDYLLPEKDKEREYFSLNEKKLRNKYSITYLDFPPCYFSQEQIELIENDILRKEVTFFYNDIDYIMHERKYLKKRLNFNTCYSCVYSKFCDMLSESYYVMKYDRLKNSIVVDLE